jgi:hypothetical protein
MALAFRNLSASRSTLAITTSLFVLVWAATHALSASGAARPGPRDTFATPGQQNEVLFRTVYPSSGTANGITATGWTGVQYPRDGGIPQPRSIEFGPPPGSPSDPFFPTTSVARFSLKPFYVDGRPRGDVTGSAYASNRVETLARLKTHGAWPDPVDSTRWFAYSVFVPGSFVVGPNWFDFTQWKGAISGPPAIAMEIRERSFYLGGAHGDYSLGSIDRGHWTRFVIGIHFSGSQSAGWVTLYKDNNLLLDHAPTQTMNDITSAGRTVVDPSYLKMGIYRSTSWTTTAVLDFAPLTEGTSLRAVSPTSP